MCSTFEALKRAICLLLFALVEFSQLFCFAEH